MNNAKAKEAKEKAAMHLALAALAQEQGKTPDLQPEYILPGHRIGTVPAGPYSVTNQIDGNTNSAFVHPET